jgi:hypothetical protein
MASLPRRSSIEDNPCSFGGLRPQRFNHPSSMTSEGVHGVLNLHLVEKMAVTARNATNKTMAKWNRRPRRRCREEKRRAIEEEDLGVRRVLRRPLDAERRQAETEVKLLSRGFCRFPAFMTKDPPQRARISMPRLDKDELNRAHGGRPTCGFASWPFAHFGRCPQSAQAELENDMVASLVKGSCSPAEEGSKCPFNRPKYR